MSRVNLNFQEEIGLMGLPAYLARNLHRHFCSGHELVACEFVAEIRKNLQTKPVEELSDSTIEKIHQER